jgi:hypothetical protein
MLLIFVWYSVGRPWIWNSCDVIIDEHNFYGHNLDRYAFVSVLFI